MDKVKKIAVLTSGGDAPGMNAAIRAVTRTAINNRLEVVGILEGYSGLIDGNFINLDSQKVSGIIQRGGTILRSARSKRFTTEEGLLLAAKQMSNNGIDGLVVIGGDGTFRGAAELSEKSDIPVIGIPATIDNDIFGTEYTIGYDTCLDTVVDAIDKIRDTASSHNRIFFVEVMGNESGFVALNSGIACGAEVILVPEQSNQIEKTREFLLKGARKDKSSIIIVSERLKEGSAIEIAERMKQEFPQFDFRVSVLGYIQRGGSPSAKDRIHASEFGVAAVMALLAGKSNVMVGLKNNKIVFEPFQTAKKMHRTIDLDLVKTAESIGTYTPLD